MAPALMLRHAPHSPLAGTAWLEGWRLTFAGEDVSCWEGALATVVEDPTSRVFVALYDVPTRDERRLDKWEASAFMTDKIAPFKKNLNSSGFMSWTPMKADFPAPNTLQ